MSVTLEELWLGNLEPLRKFGMYDPHIRRLERQIEECREALKKELSGQNGEQFSQYLDLMDDYLFSLNQCAFCDGFSLGTKLTAEALLRVERLE